MRRAWLFASVVSVSALGVLTTQGPASADESPNLEAARAAFERGAKLASEERWLDALAEFEASAKLRPHATTTYNIGYCLRALGRPTRAKKHFAEALSRDDATAGKELTPQLRAAAQKYLEEAKAKIATPWLSIDPGDATVTIDGSPLEASGVGHYLAGTRPAGPGEKVNTPHGFVVEIDSGPHEIVVVAPDGRNKVVHEDFAAGTTKSVRIEVPKPVLRSDGNPVRRTWGFVLGGVGIAALGLGSYLGLRARSTWHDALDACPGKTNCKDDRGSELAADAKVQANLSTLAFVAGGAALLGGTILVLTSTGSSEPKATVSASVAPSGGFVSVFGRF